MFQRLGIEAFVLIYSDLLITQFVPYDILDIIY